MKSIRLKLLIGILFILAILLVGILGYGITFKSYFQQEKLSEMRKVISSVEGNIEKQGIKDIDVFIGNISDEYSVQIDLEDAYSEKVICATHKPGKNSMMNGMGGQNRFETLNELGNINGVKNSIIHDKSTGINFLIATKNINDEQYKIIIKTPISIIDDAVKKSLKFLFIIFAPITLFVVILTVIYSKIFTNPIIKINRKVTKIEYLDFSDDVEVKGRDEIASLANSVNRLSKTIEHTLKELRNKNISLENMIEKERENELIRREFVSSVSHELKSPIAVLSGYAQVLKSGVITSQSDREYYVEVINEEANRMQIIVNDLLDLYKLESNSFKLNIEDVSLDNLINNIVKKNSLKFQEADITLDCNIEKVNILADKVRLEQAIQNYINNAISHIDKERFLGISVRVDGDIILISVYNTGNNIEEESLEKIWQGFVRVDKVRNYKEKRVGLGLAIVKQIVNLHKGQCGVINKENGVEFYIKLNKC